MSSLLSPEHQVTYSRCMESLEGLKLDKLASEQSFPKQAWLELCNTALLRSSSKQAQHSAHKPSTLFLDIAIKAYAIAQHTQSLGLAMTIIGQELKLYFLDTPGTSTIHRECSSQIAAGGALCALAISEPGAGAHPKHLNCAADRDGDDYLISGEKTYVTHGPYADWFIVLAITERTTTGKAQSKKEFSAFLLPRNTPGLNIKAMTVDSVLEPVAHANLHLDQCRVPKENLLGGYGLAFDELSKPMRSLEDVLMQCAIAGALQGKLDRLAPSRDNQDDMAKLGHILCLTEAATKLGIMAAESLDHSGHHNDPVALILGFRTLANEAAVQLRDYLLARNTLAQNTTKNTAQDAAEDLQGNISGDAVFKDIELLMTIGSGATGLKVAKLAQQFYAR